MKRWFKLSIDGSKEDDLPVHTHDSNYTYFKEGKDDSQLLIDLPDLLIGWIGYSDSLSGLWIEVRKEVT